MSGNWAMTCPKCQHRRRWTGPQFPVPPCRCEKPVATTTPVIAAAAGSGGRKIRISTRVQHSDDALDAIEQCDAIVELIGSLPDEAYDFGESIRAQTDGIRQTINERGTVTKPQRQALDNMERGVRKWLRDDDDE